MPSTSSRHLYLENQYAELRERLERVRRDRNRSDAALDPDFSEQAVQSENDEVLEGLERSLLADLQQIDHALAHLNRGQGDSCEHCGKPIGASRLAAVPHATACIDCVRVAEIS